MDARIARRTRPALVSLSAVALAAASALPAAAAPNKVVYDALGDSYAAGSGASFAYAHVLDGRMKIDLDDFAAVGGATIPTMGAQLRVLNSDTDLVTVSIGGNDIGWAWAISTCGLGFDPVTGQPMDCGTAVFVAQSLISQLPTALDGVYAEIGNRADNAHVAVTGYPRLFSPEYGDYTSLYTVAPGVTLPFEVTISEQVLLNGGADTLNDTIRGVAQIHGFQFVDVTDKFLGHGVNSPDAYISGVTGAVPFHPTDEGQKAYGATLTSQINPRSLR